MRIVKIRPVKQVAGDYNSYCGPSAISAVTGMSGGEAARIIRHLTESRCVKGVYVSDMRMALEYCGIFAAPTRLPKEKPTLTQWLKFSRPYRDSKKVWLVVAGNHYQVIQGRRYVCGLTKEIVSIKDPKVKRRARVAHVYELRTFDDKGVRTPWFAKKPPTRDTFRQARVACTKKFSELEKLGVKLVKWDKSWEEPGYLEVDTTGDVSEVWGCVADYIDSERVEGFWNWDEANREVDRFLSHVKENTK